MVWCSPCDQEVPSANPRLAAIPAILKKVRIAESSRTWHMRMKLEVWVSRTRLQDVGPFYMQYK